jgi:phosphoribosylanthranilate isomerase
MRTRVKICGITRVEHGVAAAHAGADAIGVVFWAGTPRRVAPAQAAAIVAALPPFVTVVGLVVDPAPDEVRAVQAVVPLDVLQFHGHEPPELCRAFGRPYLKAIPVAAGAAEAGLLEYAARYPDAAGLLFDAPPAGGLPGGTGRTFDWSTLPAGLARPLVLSGGLRPDNVREAIRRVRPWAVDVSSGVEAIGADGRAVKGVKDPARIAAFIEEVRHADV